MDTNLTENQLQPCKETSYTRRLKDNFAFFAGGGFLYAVFYTFCMYKNASGITHPFFVAGSLFFYFLCMKKLEISIKKDKWIYMGGILLLAVSTFCTDDGKIIAMNKTGIFVLTISFLLHQFYDDTHWKFGKYLAAILCTVFGSIGEIARPFIDGAGFRKKKQKKNNILLYAVIGTAIAIPLFLVVWVLLMYADQVFRSMTEELYKSIDFVNVIGILFTVVFVFFAVYCILSYLCEKHLGELPGKEKKWEALPGIVITLPLTILYVIFSGIQVVCLFMGKIDTANYTYAEYARGGFFQLLFVCILNLVLVLLGAGQFKKSIVLKVILTVMSFCTYIMIASSAMRMILYIQYYFLTFLRLFVLWSLAVLFILLSGVLVSIYRERFPLFRYSMAVVTICYLLLSFSHPDYWIARCNVGQIHEMNQEVTASEFFYTSSYEDYVYLSGLSADAAPVLIPYLESRGYDMQLMKEEVNREEFWGYRSEPDEWGQYYLKEIYEDMQEDGFRKFNLSRAIASSYLKK